MIEIHRARGWEIGAAKSLWTDTFGDAAAFQDNFYRLCCTLEGPLVLIKDGELCSMLALPQMPLILADGRRLRAGYIYALATHPDRRGQGCAAMLIETAAGLARNRGFDCLLTVPAQPSLFDFFAGCGFQACFPYRQEEFSPAPAQAEPVSPMEYAELRERLLTGRTHTAYNSGQLTFQQFLCPRPGSGLYRLELAHGPACAAVENWPDAPVVKELLCAPEDTEQGGAACAALCGCPVQVRFQAEDGQPFAAVRWLEGTPQSIRSTALNGWLGLAFD